ncbi:VPA1269 family protein [Thauera sp.]|uniref:gamma-mobile-trio integrase GmtZ n=1 Tax=Thauera sp. TaxID=1905334 RepID=UPI002CC047A3|nr:VPA1269 family protein [Thauera sp.]HRP25161.1 VPA1269 family protein [Thauera sp.]
MAKGKKIVAKIDPEFRFLLAIDPAFEAWRLLVVEWLATQKKPQNRYAPLAVFFVRYLQASHHDKRPAELFKQDACLPDLWGTLRSDGLAEYSAAAQHDHISDFLDWVLREKLTEPDANGHKSVPTHLANPFPRRRDKRQFVRVDSEFLFLLAIDPAFEAWRLLAVEWLAPQENAENSYPPLNAFFTRYLHASDLDKRPVALFKQDARLPDLWATLGLDSLVKNSALTRHDCISDFLDWVLREKLTEADAKGHKSVPTHLANPFPRRRRKRWAFNIDSEFRFLLEIDPTFEAWRVLVVEWLATQKSPRKQYGALHVFLVQYLHARQLDKRPMTLFQQGTDLPDLFATLGLDRQNDCNAKVQKNKISDFLEWVLREKLAQADAKGPKVVPAHLSNPFPRRKEKRQVVKIDPEFRFLLAIDPAFEAWRVLAVEWFTTHNAHIRKCSALTAFFVRYLQACQLPKRPADLFEKDARLPDLWATLRLDGLIQLNAEALHDEISDFLDWVLQNKFTETDREGRKVVPTHLANPFPRRKEKRQIAKVDAGFRFLLAIDPEFEAWRELVVEWLATQKSPKKKYGALTAFFVRYLQACQLDKRPAELLKKEAHLPDLWATLRLDDLTESNGKAMHDEISDFLGWVLREKFAEADGEGHNVVPPHLANPFPRIRDRASGKGSDLCFTHLEDIDPRMESWRSLAAEWLKSQFVNLSSRRAALDTFLVKYIIRQDLPCNPIIFLKRSTPKPVFSEILAASKIEGAISPLGRWEISLNNIVADFLDWLLKEKLSIEDDNGQLLIPSEFHNPVTRLSFSGIASPTESVRPVLSIRYIKELRQLLGSGPNFCDWKWAQRATDGRRGGGDWFAVDPKIIDRTDPDCVWRERPASVREKALKDYPAKVFEIWSPVRATALLLKLELPLRTFQVRMLDSGEADTWRYTARSNGAAFELNDSPLATGNASRPYQRGIFHRYKNESGVGLFINTNKTADVNKAESAKGYVIPWAHENALYWLEKLRNWQERYNPIDSPSAWANLKRKHFGFTPPHPKILEERGNACFLFRDAAAVKISDRRLPIGSNALDNLWYRLLAELERLCAERDATLNDGSAIKFVYPTPDNTHFSLHSLRVSLITYLVLDQQLPLAAVSKLIVGHSGLLMTIYYTKCGHAYMKEVLEAAERNAFAADEANHRRFLLDATIEQVSQRFASVSVDAMRAAVGHKSAATYVFEDKGICPVGGAKCDVGGDRLNDRLEDTTYAPVPGYPSERNCVRCRFFLSGPAWLPGLQAHFNTISYETHERAERHNSLQKAVTDLENHRNHCQREGLFFTEARELERLSQRYEEEAEAMGKLINDLQATYHLIARSLEILKEKDSDGVQLVAVGEMQDIQVAFTEAKSEMHQIEVLCENATINLGIDARKPAMRRGQLLDCMLEYNRIPPIFFRLNPQQQLDVGNAVMKLIQARTGSLGEALEFVEGGRRLCDLGILDEAWDVLAASVASTPAREIIESARGKRVLSAFKEESDAS